MPVPELPARLWLVPLGCLLGFALLWWWLLGAPRHARRRALDTRIRRWERMHAPVPAEVRRGLRAAVAAGRRALGALGHRHLLYRQPWLLFIGDPAADLVGLLATAHPPGPADPGATRGGDAFWRFWLMARMSVLEVCPPPVTPATPQDALWLRALRELAVQRPRLPLNGIALCVSVGVLRSDVSVARPVFDLLCRRAHDVAAALRLRLPVYVLVTGLHRLSGHATVCAALPPQALERALGHRQADDAAGERWALDAPGALDRVWAPLMAQLHALRLGLLPGAADARQRADIHGFVEEMQALRPGLLLLMERLANAAPVPPSLLWRGLYFTAPAPGASFVDDLFQRLLPADQPLARPLR